MPALTEAWAKTLAVLWNKTQDSVGFCIGRSPRRVLDLLALSWPWPLPVDETGGAGVCSNRTRIDVHLCGPLEIEQYYKASQGGPTCWTDRQSKSNRLRCSLSADRTRR